MRTNLKVFRVSKNLKQEEIAEMIGVSRTAYSAIESGKRNANQSFWNSLQKKFNVPDAEMWRLTVNEEARNE